MKVDTYLLDKQKKYIVGVSGGCDSMSLLHYLIHHQYNIIVCHVNYHYRHDSNIDQELVKSYCAQYEIPYFIKEIHEHDEKQNFQMQARIQRYDFYHQIALMHECQAVILAHHLDDVLETIYMQKMRHSQSEYLGVKEVSNVQNINVIRPLLKNTKQEILKYCKQHHIPYHDDYTNFETNFSRDYVRNEVLNHFSEEDKLQLLKEADEYNKQMLQLEQELIPLFKQYDKNKVIDYTSLNEKQLRRVVYYMLKSLIYPPLISASLLDEIIKQINSKKPNVEIQLPVNHLFIKEYHNIRIVLDKKEVSYRVTYDKYIYDKQKYFILQDYGHMNEGIFLKESDYPITIRSFQSGDRIVTSSGTKKLSRLFINAKIPKELRNIWPIVVRNDGTILLVPNIAKNIEYLSTKPNVFVIKYLT